MADLDLAYYEGVDKYSDGDTSENYLLDMATAGQSLDDIPAEDCSWPVFYHMTPIRENICNWYPFKENASILEIGAGCGAVTGILCQKAAQVTAVELSYRRAKINYERNKNYDNLRIVVGNMNDICLEQKFDYVTLIGVLEYAGRFTEGKAPFHTFLNALKRFLKPDGILLIAIENRLGLKYFCGAAEDHTNRICEGINQYPNYDGVKTFSKQELTDLLQDCGFGYRHFYYPYPDYKLPQEIFTRDSIGRNKVPYITYDQDRISLFDEADMFNQLTKEQVGECFANSFFVEASEETISHSGNIIYCKLNQNRRPEFRIGTFIRETDKGTIVEKVALHPAGQEHIRKIFEFSRQSYGAVPAIPMEQSADGVYYFYNPCQTMAEFVKTEIEKDSLGAINLVNEYLQKLTRDSCLMNYDTPGFTQWFGGERLEYPAVSCISTANIDAVLSNILYDGTDFMMIDCEWVTDFPIPVDFLYWRVIFALFVQIPALRRYISMEAWLLALRVNMNWIPTFQSWEDHFQSEYVNSGGHGPEKKNDLVTLEFGLEDRLNKEIARLNEVILEQEQHHLQQISAFQAQLQAMQAAEQEQLLRAEIQEHQIAAFKGNVEFLEKETLRLKQRVNYLVNCIYSGAQTVGKLAEYRDFKLIHLEKRIKHQLFSKDRTSRKAFWKWLSGRLHRQTCDDHAYNPLYEVVDALYGPGDNQPEVIQISDDAFWGASRRIDIMTPGHTLYLARRLAENLHRAGYTCEIHDEQFCEFEDIPYIVICAQIMKALPPHYICYQMEQTINSRWLTDQYFAIMRNALAVLDYSLVNVGYFSQYPDIKKKLFYCPIGLTEESVPSGLPAEEQNYDILFYGDSHCERRKAMLDELQKDFSVRIETNLFGEAMLDAIRRSKIVINIHYYKDALLETTRIAEILSLGSSIIVSERSNDPDEDNRMAPFVDFVDIDDIDEMKRRISWWLDHSEERLEKLRKNREMLLAQLGDSNFYFYRFLLASKQMEFDQFYDLTQKFIQIPQNLRWCLHLPEQVERKKTFEEVNQFQFSFFPGLKYPVGWVGCALSYKYMFRKLRDQGAEYAIICEDDVTFPNEFHGRFDNLQQHLSTLPKWDMVSGFMADISDDVTVSRVDRVNGDIFLSIDKMVSTVFNIYNQKAIFIGSEWDDKNHDTSNTIDRYFEAFSMDVILDYPFLVGHNEDLQSILWDKNNAELYDEMTKKTIEKIEALIAQYETKQ